MPFSRTRKSTMLRTAPFIAGAQFLSVVQHCEVVGRQRLRTLDAHALLDGNADVTVGGALGSRAAHRAVADDGMAVAHG